MRTGLCRTFTDAGDARLLCVGRDGCVGCGRVLRCPGGGVVSNGQEKRLVQHVRSGHVGTLPSDRLGHLEYCTFFLFFSLTSIRRWSGGQVVVDETRRVEEGRMEEVKEPLLMMPNFGGGDSRENLGAKVHGATQSTRPTGGKALAVL